MMVRLSKTFLVAAVALYYTLVVFNNLNDYQSNDQFVRHVLLMDSTFPGNRGMWRAIRVSWVQELFYWSLIAWEAAAMALTWAGVMRLLRSLGKPAAEFQPAKNLAAAGLTAGLLLWLVAFLSIGGEWFLMWQSRTWNGEDAAARMFLVVGVVLIVLLLPED